MWITRPRTFDSGSSCSAGAAVFDSVSISSSIDMPPKEASSSSANSAGNSARRFGTATFSVGRSGRSALRTDLPGVNSAGFGAKPASTSGCDSVGETSGDSDSLGASTACSASTVVSPAAGGAAPGRAIAPGAAGFACGVATISGVRNTVATRGGIRGAATPSRCVPILIRGRTGAAGRGGASAGAAVAPDGRAPGCGAVDCEGASAGAATAREDSEAGWFGAAGESGAAEEERASAGAGEVSCVSLVIDVVDS